MQFYDQSSAIVIRENSLSKPQSLQIVFGSSIYEPSWVSISIDKLSSSSTAPSQAVETKRNFQEAEEFMRNIKMTDGMLQI
jgi:hypothetical protein